MSGANLVLVIPHGSVVATSLGIEELARRLSPGAGKYFHGRALYVDLALDGGKPAFTFLDEGGWRDAAGDTATALAACVESKKHMKTALSNNAFSLSPVDAYRGVYLAKTGGQVLEMEKGIELSRFKEHTYKWGKTLSCDEVAEQAGVKKPAERRPRLYMVLAPLEMVVLSNLSPEEYGWYATHRPGKVFRQVLFTELKPTGRDLVADTVYETAVAELSSNPSKKTKTIYTGNAMNRIGFQSWVGYVGNAVGGVYVGDHTHIKLWKFPPVHSSAWDRAD